MKKNNGQPLKPIPFRTIAIELCDNDFGNTFRNLLETVNRVLVYQAGMPECNDRKSVEEYIRAGVRFHYLAFQAQLDRKENDLEHTMKYLEKINVLFDTEAEESVATKDHDGGSWYLEVPTGRVFSY